MNDAREKITESEEETIECAKEFARELQPGDILALQGDLGSGKTTFIKGVALGLGFLETDNVTSPTFALMNIYDAKIPIYHFDLYRLENPSEVVDIGFEEFVSNSKAISCVEWPEKAGNLIPDDTKRIQLEVVSENKRLIRFLNSKRE